LRWLWSVVTLAMFTVNEAWLTEVPDIVSDPEILLVCPVSVTCCQRKTSWTLQPAMDPGPVFQAPSSVACRP
jgi:hypothetical protein